SSTAPVLFFVCVAVTHCDWIILPVFAAKFDREIKAIIQSVLDIDQFLYGSVPRERGDFQDLLY
ncbi:hypothetical protein XF27_24795, partial [Escherichia coli]